MKILFLGYWGANEGLSQATINPHLEILSKINKVHKIIYVSIERNRDVKFNIPVNSKIEHVPFNSIHQLRVFQKFYDFLSLPILIYKLTKKHKIQLVICRSSLAGGIGYLASKLTRKPFTVESFEPHADYMRSLSIWNKYGLSYLIQKYLELKQKKTALFLMPVSYQEKLNLLESHIKEERIFVMPCAVQVSKFEYSSSARNEVRVDLNLLPKHTVGVYSGKFGGLYLDSDAYLIFKKMFSNIPNFFLIILTSENKHSIISQLNKVGIQEDSVLIKFVPHNQVSNYLSAADFAFSLHRPTSFSHAFSPIKNGEYWANGLPILSTPQIGDDSKLIEDNNVGVILNNQNEVNLEELRRLINKRKKHPTELSVVTKKICATHRDFRLIEGVYRKILKSL
ncbi:Glycosyltransferase involved in cell wall bisynthesis [Reichenbachiella faecimaris]|uniref:Glycosyltransferase involved in cell wall bisynthesis n=1 Tax=Reichenbachiella faecimaris TaxID=692418 RepID=A0A1W2GJ08_REIFA|nr:hypothetical protein [Reichenbachiella faecimaris]SMD36462.1 Glycosyltransferase involved in cell wall bisynthesis [Reichenbachiella faecimaris]